jgi:transposase
MAGTPPIPEPLWSTASPELQAAILALVAAFEQRVAQLEARVNDLENRLKLNSTNSSKPPSSDPIGLKRKPPAASTGKKRGGQPGHRKAHRALVPAEKIRETVHCKPVACRRCGHALSGDDSEPLVHQVAELPRIEPTVDEYRLHRLTCTDAVRRPAVLCPQASRQGVLALTSKPCWQCWPVRIASANDRFSS